jgi:adenosylcobinamide-phosphate guanylyltransferase
MHALIMAGGAGTRLHLGEKPLIDICGKPMVSYVVDAFRQAKYEPVIVTSPKTPMTANWCRANDVEFCKADGIGYIEDFVQATVTFEIAKPVFISVSDIPCVTADILRKIIDMYKASGKEGCSTWVPSSMVRSCRESMPYREKIEGTDACPAGLNILLGNVIDRPQEELQILVADRRLAMNVNTRTDLAEVREFIRKNSG